MKFAAILIWFSVLPFFAADLVRVLPVTDEILMLADDYFPPGD